jgi:hypothetical protein
MTDRPTRSQREAMIAGDRAGSLDSDESAELTLLADLLADPATWAEPGAGLEDSIVDAVAAAGTPVGTTGTPGPRRTASSRRWSILVSAAAVIAIIVAVGAMTAGRKGAHPEFEAALTATAAEPAARASVGVRQNSSGFRISMNVTGLPALPPAEYYQAWLKNGAGSLVPVGTFSAGTGPITLWSGVSPENYPTMTVTIEAADNDQASSGRLVLVGEVHRR